VNCEVTSAGIFLQSNNECGDGNILHWSPKLNAN